MARTQDLTFEQGADKNIKLSVRDSTGGVINLTSKSFAAGLKTEYSSNTTIDMTVTVVDAVNGLITLGLSAAETAQLDHNRRYVYDCMMYDVGNTDIEVLVSGKVFVKPTVTRIV